MCVRQLCVNPAVHWSREKAVRRGFATQRLAELLSRVADLTRLRIRPVAAAADKRAAIYGSEWANMFERGIGRDGLERR